MKPPANLHLVLQPADLAALNSLCGRFYAYPLAQDDLALVLLRYGFAKVERQPWLLRTICRLFENQTKADILALDSPIISAKFQAHILSCMTKRPCTAQEAVDYIMRLGTVHGEMCGWQDGRGRM